jgi:hypothetical protein
MPYFFNQFFKDQALTKGAKKNSIRFANTKQTRNSTSTQILRGCVPKWERLAELDCRILTSSQ